MRTLIAFSAILTLRAAGSAAQTQTPASSPFATQAKVTVQIPGGELPLKLEEKIAFMFIAAIKTMEDDCQRHAGHPCTLEELATRPKSNDGWPMRRLKFDPAKADPNYTYKITVDGNNWEAWATPKKPGLGGFYDGGGFMRKTYYNPKGAATSKDQQVSGHTIDGDSFAAP